jgi:hypothetical protein
MGRQYNSDHNIHLVSSHPYVSPFMVIHVPHSDLCLPIYVGAY